MRAILKNNSYLNNRTQQVHNDHRNTPQVITAQNQSVLWMADYEPFGKVKLSTGSITFTERFPGQHFDTETGLYQNYFRDYDSSIGRYVESDPIGLNGGINTYGYVSANPLKYFDFFGLSNCHFTAEGYRVCTGPDIDPLPNRCPSGDCAVYPPNVNDPKNYYPLPPTLGDCISQPNGNVWGTPKKQDNVCSLPEPLGTLGDRTVLPRCQRHDDCYAASGCTASSWVSSGLGGTKSCNQCNSGFFQ